MTREEMLTRVMTALGYRFADPDLLRQALRHRSAAFEQQEPSSERLEFLGDAALSHAVAMVLFAAWTNASEGELTRGRAALVRERTLAMLAVELAIPAALEVGGGLQDDAPPPSLLADAFEATLGALLLDGGWPAFFAVTERLFTPLVAQLDRERLAIAEEPKSALQELAQLRGLPLPVYREIEEQGPEHRRTYVFEVEFGGRVMGLGEGSSKKAAQQAAAARALEALTADPDRGNDADDERQTPAP
jgi:ribonuclease-3